jgi:hypothetical protein
MQEPARFHDVGSDSLPESEMCAVLVVVANILRESAFQVAFVDCNDVI